MERFSKYNIDLVFTKRYSPREFLDKDISETDLLTILEAASTAPSCFNEQPWRFVLGEKDKFLEILMEGNREWNRGLNTFILLCSKENFERKNRDGSLKRNVYNSFDAGTSWGYMTIQGQLLGISMHAMAGFDSQRAKEIFHLEDDIKPEAVISLGYAQDPKEFTQRKDLESVIIRT